MFDKLKQLSEAFWRAINEVHSHIADPEQPDDTDEVSAALAKLTTQNAGYGVSLNGRSIRFQQEGLGSELFSLPLVVAKQYGWPEYGETIFLPFVVTSSPDEAGMVSLEIGDIDFNSCVKVSDVYRLIEPLDK